MLRQNKVESDVTSVKAVRESFSDWCNDVGIPEDESRLLLDHFHSIASIFKTEIDGLMGICPISEYTAMALQSLTNRTDDGTSSLSTSFAG